jgi:NAD(P)H dehydrogenase (quinone)
MYLVTGASGHLAQLVIDQLINGHKIPAVKIIATTRKPDALAALAKTGVQVRAADFDSVEGLAAAFSGAERLLLISTDAMDKPGRRLAQHRNAVAAAEKAGVKHLLYTSMPGPETSAVLFAPDHLGTEQAIAVSALPGWTILRNNWYFENLAYNVPQALASGTWYTAAGDGKVAHLARADLAKAAAAALAGTSSGKVTYTLTGTRGYTTAEIAKLVSAAVAKPLAVVQVPEDALVQGMVGAGLPEPVAKMFASFDTNTRQGGLAIVTGDVKTLTGSDPQSFEEWLAANKAAFAS